MLENNIILKNKKSKFIGFKKDGVSTFLGIKYATAKRFCIPKMLKSYPRKVDCTKHGDICFQAPNYQNFKIKQSENCLNLNIWTPNIKPDKKMPVYFYIHGGCFTFGTGSEPVFNGGKLAQKGIVVVTINYRLNMFGFFGIKETREKINGKDTNCNWGILDQIEALKWVHENIELFGGDINNITIAGESAGSFSVSCLLMSPLTNPKIVGYKLFHKAVMESGNILGMTGFNKAHCNLEKTEELFLNLSYKIASENGLKINKPKKVLKYMKNVKFEKIMKYFQAFDSNAMSICPTFDGIVLPLNVNEAIKNNEYRSDVDIISGFNTDEAHAWVEDAPIFGEQYFKGLISTFLWQRNADEYIKNIECEINTTNIWVSQSRFVYDMALFCAPLVAHMLKLKNNVYFYNFNFTSKLTPIPLHTAELKYIFGNGLRNKEDIECSNKIMSLWTNFMHSGIPKTEDIQWNKFDQKLNCLWINKDGFANNEVWSKKNIMWIIKYFDQI